VPGLTRRLRTPPRAHLKLAQVERRRDYVLYSDAFVDLQQGVQQFGAFPVSRLHLTQTNAGGLLSNVSRRNRAR